jgi:hypothetical protein
MRFCAVRRNRTATAEAICFLGATKAAPAAEPSSSALLVTYRKRPRFGAPTGRRFGMDGSAVTVQPLRGTKEGRNRERVAYVVEPILDLLKAHETSACHVETHGLAQAGKR